MSIVRILDHDESIYNIKGEFVPEITFPAKYTSKYRRQVAEELRRNKQGHKTLGVAEVPKEKPSEYLKKFTRPTPPRPVITEPRCLKGERRPPLPPRPAILKKPPADGEGKDNNNNDRNYRADNILRAIRLVPRQPKRVVADTKSGDLQPLEASGLVPKFMLKKTYGKLPKYLMGYVQEHREVERKRQEEQYREKPGVRYISQSERKDMLEGLRHNWHELMGTFLALPVLTDTPAKINRKLRLEAELKQLEHDIRTLERHPIIYVVDDITKYRVAS